MERLLDVTLHLASRNLPFKGKTKDLDDIHNGNCLGTLELLSHYDPLLKEHFQKNQGQQTKTKRRKRNQDNTILALTVKRSLSTYVVDEI